MDRLIVLVRGEGSSLYHVFVEDQEIGTVLLDHRERATKDSPARDTWIAESIHKPNTFANRAEALRWVLTQHDEANGA